MRERERECVCVCVCVCGRVDGGGWGGVGWGRWVRVILGTRTALVVLAARYAPSATLPACAPACA